MPEKLKQSEMQAAAQLLSFLREKVPGVSDGKLLKQFKVDKQLQREFLETQVFNNKYYDNLREQLILAEVDVLQKMVSESPELAKKYKTLMKKHHLKLYTCAYFDKEFDDWLQKPRGTDDLVLDDGENELKITRHRDHEYNRDKIKVPAEVLEG
jgi:hypothetical protein